jgi:hypothetical protein
MITQNDKPLSLTIQLRGLTCFLNSDGTLNSNDPHYQAFVETVQAALNCAYDSCGFNYDDVDVIAFCNPDLIGETIYEWKDKAGVRRGYTEGGELLVTAAKTVPHRCNDGRIQSSIVINALLLGSIVDVIQAETPFEEWNADQQQWLYVVAHELGHAHDNALRHHLSEDQIELNEERDTEAISRHYAGVLASEFLACFYSSPLVTAKVQDAMINAWHELAEQLIESVLRAKLNFGTDPFLFAGHHLWIAMLEFAKLVGHRCANPSLPRPHLWDDAQPEEQEVFDAIEEFLTKQFAPNSAPDGQMHLTQIAESDVDGFVFQNLYPLWRKLCNCYGYEFDDTPASDDAEDEEKNV